MTTFFICSKISMKSMKSITNYTKGDFMSNSKGKHIFGTVTVGEKGQIVIPKKAREIFEIAPGDQLLILGDEKKGGIALVKCECLDEIAEKVMGGIYGKERSGEEN